MSADFQDHPEYGGVCTLCARHMWLRPGKGRSRPDIFPTSCRERQRPGLCDACYRRERRQDQSKGRETGVEQRRAMFVADYTLLRENGQTHAQIAERMGRDASSVIRQANRLNCLRLSKDEQLAMTWIERYRERGITFGVDCLPFVDNPAEAYNRVVRVAVDRGLIRKTGIVARSRLTGNVQVMYEAVPQ